MAAMRCGVEYLQRNDTTNATPISIFKKGKKWQQIRGDKIMAAIRAFVRVAGPEIGFTEANISASSLCTGMYGNYPLSVTTESG